MQLSTGISFVALVVSIVTLVLVFQLFIWGRSEPPKDNSLACTQLLAISGSITFPDPENFDVYREYEYAKIHYYSTIQQIEADRDKLGCPPPP